MTLTEDGPWVTCPRCSSHVGLARFAPDDDEPGVSAAICDGCAERVMMVLPAD